MNNTSTFGVFSGFEILFLGDSDTALIYLRNAGGVPMQILIPSLVTYLTGVTVRG
jgi:hypothetical protein